MTQEATAVTKPPPAASSYRLNPKRRILRKLILFSLAAALVGHQWWGRSEDCALESCVAELRRSGEPVLPADFHTAPMNPADNAAILLQAAADASPDTDEQWNHLDAYVLGTPLTTTEALRLRRVVASFETALRHASAATTRPAVDWGEAIPSPVLLHTGPDPYNDQRRLANFLGAAALFAHHDGDDARALGHVREMLFSSRATGRYPANVAHVASAGLADSATRILNQFAPTLRIARDQEGAVAPDDVRTLINELLDENELNERLLVGLRGDRAWRYDALRSLADGVAPLRMLRRTPPNELGWGDDLQRIVLRPLLLDDARVMLRDIERVLACVGLPDWPTASDRLNSRPSEIEGHYLRHFFGCALMPHYEYDIQCHYTDLTNRRLAAVSLAVRWYATDHGGKLPASLDKLAPSYLPAVPLDPMARQRRLGHVSDPRRPAVYSMGHNGVDDGGSDVPICQGSDNPDPWVHKDVVVHLTAQPRRPDDIDVVFPPPETDLPIE